MELKTLRASAYLQVISSKRIIIIHLFF